MAKVDAITKRNNLQSKIMSNALLSGAKINIADKYCAKAITNTLYPRATEKKLKILVSTNLELRLSIWVKGVGCGVLGVGFSPKTLYPTP